MSLNPEVFDRLTRVSRRMMTSRATITRLALIDWFQKHDPTGETDGAAGRALTDALMNDSMRPERPRPRRRKPVDLTPDPVTDAAHQGNER
jgi:hypothetical protein